MSLVANSLASTASDVQAVLAIALALLHAGVTTALAVRTPGATSN